MSIDVLPDGYEPPTDTVTASRIVRIVAAFATSATSVVVAVKHDGEWYKAQAFVFWSGRTACSPFVYDRPLWRDSEQEALDRLEAVVREYASAYVRLRRRDADTKRLQAAMLLDEAKSKEDRAATIERVLEER